MTGILLAYGSATRGGRLPNLTTQNMIVEPSATEPEKGVVLLTRPTFQPRATAGSGPVRGFFQKKGLFNDDAIILSGQTVYRLSAAGVVTACTGTVPGVAQVDIDGGQNLDGAEPVDEVRIATGSGLYLLTGTTVAAETLPDDVDIVSIMNINGFWEAAIADSGRALIKIPGEAWQLLDSVVAEKSPDNLTAVRPLGDVSVLMGDASIEGWGFTGTADPPIRRIPGQTFPIGCLARAAACVVGDVLIFPGTDNIVYEYTTYPKAISDFGLSEQIRLTDPLTIRAWAFGTDQHTYYLLRLGKRGTWVFDLSARKWAEWSSYSKPYLKQNMGAQLGGTVLAADDEAGDIYIVNPDEPTDGESIVPRRFSGYLPLKGGRAIIDSVSLHCSVGVGLQSGDGSDPLIGMSYSTDNGKTWTDFEYERLGAIGEFETRVIWRRLGLLDAPGVFFEWFFTEPVQLTINDARANED